MALISELLANVLLLVTRAFSILKLVCLFAIRTTLVLIYTWIELVRTAISFHVNIILGIITWAFGLILLPARVLNAYQREKQLELKLHQMQTELDNLEWDQRKLKEHYQMAVKECKIMEMLLSELEEEHDVAIAKIDKLEGKLHDQINENLRLREVQGKDYWNSKNQNTDNDPEIQGKDYWNSKNQNTDNGQNIDDDGSYNTPPPTVSLKSSYSGSGVSLQDLLIHKDRWKDETKPKTELLKLLKTGPKSKTISTVKPELTSKDIEVSSEVLDNRRDVAISQSIFSAIMSIAVGVTVWEAEDSCMPLIVALFAVVGMSLKSVVQFFFTVRNKPASDAVALLSFNWFILGTLTYPTLPRVAHMMAPLVLRFVDQTMSRFGLLSFV